MSKGKLLRLVFQLRAAPVATLGVVLDGGVRLQTEPLRQRAVLFLLLGKKHLELEGLDGSHLF